MPQPHLQPPFWVISDTHFYHDNIVKYCNRMEHTGGRDHNAYMVDKWNSVVGRDDKVLHLGDLYAWFKNGRERFEANVLPRLNGRIYLILGNHDKDERRIYKDMGITVLNPFVMRYKDRVVSFHHYPWTLGAFDADVRVHGHIHNNGYPITDDWKDGTVPSAPNQINVSVEMIDYTPQRIDTLLDNYFQENAGA